MKKIICGILCLVLIFTVSACSNAESSTQTPSTGNTTEDTVETEHSSGLKVGDVTENGIVCGIYDDDILYYRQGFPDSDGSSGEGSVVVTPKYIPDEIAAAMDDHNDTVRYGIHEIEPADISLLTATPLSDLYGEDCPEELAGYTRLVFDGAAANTVYGDPSEFVITDGGSATLHIRSCIWLSEEFQDLEIGIYNWSTAENWYVVRPGEHVNDYTRTFSDLTAGTYSLYVRNLGKNPLTNGYMVYNLV